MYVHIHNKVKIVNPIYHAVQDKRKHQKDCLLKSKINRKILKIPFWNITLQQKHTILQILFIRHVCFKSTKYSTNNKQK